MLVGLLRHGEVQGGAQFRGSTDDALTAAGWAQMQAAVAADPRWADHCTEGRKWNRVISSPLVRCADFARRLAVRESLPLQLEPRLQEMHFGVWEGRTSAALMVEHAEALSAFWRDPDGHPPPGGESLGQFTARVLAAWSETVLGGTAQPVLVVTHGGVIRVLLGQLLGYSTARMQRSEIAYGGLYGLHLDADGQVTPLWDCDACA
jgi:alpha-ribazole phosphatase